ncbi:MAG: dihydrolipoyl dehydrogenase [Thermaerobacterales bacterium]
MVVGEVATGTDVAVIGGGPGGYVAAIRAAQLGLDVTLIERGAMGGVCLNVGCIPSKALISASDSYHRLKDEANRGIMVDGARVDFGRMQEWKDKVVKRLAQGVEQLCKANGITLVQGSARFTGSHTLQVEREHDTETYSFKHAIIATGSRPAEIPGFAFDHENVLSSTDALALNEIPERLVVIGGGYIGLELGTVYAKLGTKVTVLEMMDALLPGTDSELVQVVARQARRLGIDVHLKARAGGWRQDGDELMVTVDIDTGDDDDDESLEIACDRILLSVGRLPNSESLGLDSAGVETNERGHIIVDDRRRTSQSHILAVGDVAGEPMLAHKAMKEGIVAAEVIAGEPAAFDPVAIPAVIFTDPEIAYVGMSEAEARNSGYDVAVGKIPFQALGRALTTGQTNGFAKLIGDADTGLLLGAQIVGPEASDLISEASLALEMGARLEDVAMTIHPHPTLGESMMEAAEAALGRAIHIPPPRKQS